MHPSDMQSLHMLLSLFFASVFLCFHGTVNSLIIMYHTLFGHSLINDYLLVPSSLHLQKKCRNKHFWCAQDSEVIVNMQLRYNQTFPHKVIEFQDMYKFKINEKAIFSNRKFQKEAGTFIKYIRKSSKVEYIYIYMYVQKNSNLFINTHIYIYLHTYIHICVYDCYCYRLT